MQPSEIRRRVLADHEALRERLDHLEHLARRVLLGGERCDALDELRALSTALLQRLTDHMGWEDRYLKPALCDADAWGEERARRMTEDHREQREQIRFLRARFQDADRPEPLVAQDVLGLAALLREDMEDEERDMLDERVLRDDVVGIEVEAG